MKTVKLWIPCCSLDLKPLTIAGKKHTQTSINIQGWKVYNFDPERLEPGATYILGQMRWPLSHHSTMFIL